MKPDRSDLNVLHISMWDNAGGSGRAAYRLHTGLQRLGVGSQMLVGAKVTSDPNVHQIGGFFHRLDKLAGSLADRMDLHYLFYPSSLLLSWNRWVRQSDVIQLFNTHGGYMSHLALISLSRHRPIVWRLSDMWAFTGHCAYSYECDRWKSGCGACPHLEEYPALRRDRSAFLWRVKERIYRKSRINIVAPSRWLENLARQSPLLNRFPIRRIPNGLDTSVFRPLPKIQARQHLGIDPAKQILLFSAASLQDKRKGADFLKKALGKLPVEERKELLLLVVGQGAETMDLGISIPIKKISPTQEDDELVWIYSAADLFILPTLADNLPNGVLESMSCGTPAVSFNVGGISDAVWHMKTGYLAQEQNADDLSAGIHQLLSRPDLRVRMGTEGRRLIEAEHTLELQASRFKELYQEVLK